jgi:hypothetical protein
MRILDPEKTMFVFLQQVVSQSQCAFWTTNPTVHAFRQMKNGSWMNVPE